MPETRRHLRLRQHMDVHWSLDGKEVSGKGTILNVSLSGVFMQLDKVFEVPDECTLSLFIELHGHQALLAEQQGKIVWFRRVNASEPFYQCGVEFVDKGLGLDQRLELWLRGKITELSEITDANILNNYVV